MSIIGRGSVFPGFFAAKICPDFIKRIKVNSKVIAVTGSNGKTTTSEMITHILKSSGKKVSRNEKGSNQVRAVTTLLLKLTGLTGRVNHDYLVLECDERSAVHIFDILKPHIFIVTNLFRDQLTRNGHPEFILDCIKNAVNKLDKDSILILNGDDPYTVTLGEMVQKATYFGIGSDISLSNDGVYDDGAYCPKCKSKMEYSYRVVAHLGGFSCTSCSLTRPGSYEIVSIEGYQRVVFSDGLITTFSDIGLINLYNSLAAITLTRELGIKTNDSVKYLEKFFPSGKNSLSLKFGHRNVFLLLSKHENSVSYNYSLLTVAHNDVPCTVVIIVDSISRKYSTNDTSWIWDVDFGLLAGTKVKHIVVAGQFANELVMRLSLTPVEMSKVLCITDLSNIAYALNDTNGAIYAITCFADKKKLVKVLNRGPYGN